MGRRQAGAGRALRPRFFLPTEAFGPGGVGDGGIAGREATLPADDAHRARKVLRARAGEPCEVVLEPYGVLVPAEFVAVGERVRVRLGVPEPYAGTPPVHVTLVQALPEPRKMDLVVEKGTEVGVDAFVVVPADGSPALPRDRLRERVERWRRVARQAAKQSRQLGVPVVETAASLQEARDRLAASAGGDGVRPAGVVLQPGAAESLESWLDRQRAVLAGAPPAPPAPTAPPVWPVWPAAAAAPVPAALAPFAPPPPALALALWVGPEGGWSAGEIGRFAAWGLSLAGLGRRVLRTETAGPVGVAVVRFSLGDW
ncbi:MAG: RsmE family RNA methyltransferase [Actinobacteria bacterium]|nr:RsmE family RNA methyltransferase [Actinomycetota bacterium]